MAEKTNSRNRNDVFWSKMETAASDEDAFVPGVTAAGNRRPSRPRCRKSKEVRANVPSRQPLVEDVGLAVDLLVSAGNSRTRKKVEGPTNRGINSRARQKVDRPTNRGVGVLKNNSSYEDESISTSLESFAERSIQHLRQASLKDLRPEDKQRVANLIKELARLGDEKERVVSELHGERENYEKQVMTLVGQQESIIREREDVQNKLFQCQKLLTEYQAQLLNKQDRLNTSVAGIKQAMTSTNSTKPPSRTNPSQPQYKEVKVMEVCPPSPCSSTPSLERSLTPVDIGPKYPSRPKPSIQNRAADSVTNERPDSHDPVDDLLTDNRDYRDGIKRPFTAMIDKEIARERSLSQSSRGSGMSRSRSVSPAIGRPHFAYPQNLAGIGPLREPIASSTHKSMEINAQIGSQLNDPSSPQSSIRGCSVRSQSPRHSQRQSSKVVFNDEFETDEFAEKHSPNMKGNGSGSFKDPQYADFYKKLSPAGRRRELLRQRQALLDEQDRLKMVLEKQEQQLKERHVEYEKRKDLQRQRMEFYQEGGKFPPLTLNFDEADSERGGDMGSLPREKLTLEMEQRGQGLDVKVTTPDDADNVEIEGDVCVRNVVSASTSPFTTPRPNRVTMATSPVRSNHEEEEELEEGLEEDLPRLIDVATSISYRSPLRDASNRQGNLPLGTNRQKHTPSPLVEQPKQTRALGEKTLNVLELVNSMEEEPEIVQNYGTPDIENRPTPRYLTSTDQSSPYRQYSSPGNLRTRQTKYTGSRTQPATSQNHFKTSQDSVRTSQDKFGTSQDNFRTSQDKFRTSQDKLRTSQDKLRTSRNQVLDDNDVSVEENKILEDVFFL